VSVPPVHAVLRFSKNRRLDDINTQLQEIEQCATTRGLGLFAASLDHGALERISRDLDLVVKAFHLHTEFHLTPISFTRWR
jgi:hypothetical protein